jgi:hypothetical protein
MMVVVLLLPLSLAIDDGEFDHSGGSAAAAAVVVVVVDNRDCWQWRLMAAAA